MAGHALVIVEDLDDLVHQPDIEALADQDMRHRVGALVDLDMIIGMDLGLLPFGMFGGERR